MNILIASVDSLPQMGGISMMGHHLANAMVQAGHDVVFLGPAGATVPRELVREYRLLEDFESRPRRRSGPTALEEDHRIRELFDATVSRYGIHRVLLLHPFYYAVGALDVCRARSIGVSVYVHGFELRSQLANRYPERLQQLVRERRIDTLRERVFYALGAADEVLVNSHFTGSVVGGFDRPPPIRVTGCGIPRDALDREIHASPTYDARARAERRARLGFPSSAPCVAFVGRLVRTKGVERILRLCRASRGRLSALIIGTGPEEERLRELTTKWGIADRVVFLGRVSESEKWQALRAADFLALLSEPDEEKGQVEGFGIALLEGAAAGAVPVTSGTGGMGDVVSHRRTGLTLPSRDDRAAEELMATARDSGRMAALVESARAQLRARYNWPSVAGRIVEGWTDAR